MKKTKEEIAEELLKRRKARKDFLSFCNYLYPSYIDGYHLKQLREFILPVINGDQRLCISLPPRHSKSLHCSILFPLFYILNSKDDEKDVIITSYSQEIASTQLNEIRKIVESDNFKSLYPHVNILIDNFKNIIFNINGIGKSIYAVGVDGGLTGRGCSLLIADDLIKNRTDANSETIRRTTLDWWKSTALTRLTPNGNVMVIGTRWHPGDIIGDILENNKNYKSLIMKAINENNEPLWKERFDLEKLNEIKKEIGLYEWECLYQCAPYSRGSGIFNIEKINWITKEQLPKNQRWIRCWDLASTIKQRASDDPDYTVGILGCVTKDKLPKVYVQDITIIREEAPKRNDIIQKIALSDGPNIIQFMEAFGSYKDAFNEMQRILMGLRTVRQSRLPGDKVSKLQPLEPILENNNLFIVENKHKDLIMRQLGEFPSGRHDDIPDAIAILCGEMLKPKSTIMII